jgi:hypothetical protein
MGRDIVDDRLIGALHVRALSRAGLQHDAVDDLVAAAASGGDAFVVLLDPPIDQLATSIGSSPT